MFFIVLKAFFLPKMELFTILKVLSHSNSGSNWQKIETIESPSMNMVWCCPDETNAHSVEPF